MRIKVPLLAATVLFSLPKREDYLLETISRAVDSGRSSAVALLRCFTKELRFSEVFLRES